MKKPDNTIALDAYKRLLAQQEAEERKRKARKKPGHEESTLQRACVAWFRAKYPDHELMLFAVPNGGGRRAKEAAIMKDEGVTAGVSDLLLLESRGGWGCLCLEAKRNKKGSVQSKAQKAWQEAAERAGNLYEVFRTFEEFKTIVDYYMALPAGVGRRVVVNAVELQVKKARLELDKNLHPEKYYSLNGK